MLIGPVSSQTGSLRIGYVSLRLGSLEVQSCLLNRLCLPQTRDV